MIAAAVVAALGAAAAFAVGSALEQRAAKQERAARPLDPRLLFRLMRQPMWLLGWVPEAAGTGLQALALHYGPLVLVEPLLVSGLFLAIPLAADDLHRRAAPGRRGGRGGGDGRRDLARQHVALGGDPPRDALTRRGA